MNRSVLDDSVNRLTHIVGLPSDSPVLEVNYRNLAGSAMAFVPNVVPVWVTWPSRYFIGWPRSLEGFQAWCALRLAELQAYLEMIDERDRRALREASLEQTLYPDHGCGSPACGYCGDHDYERKVGK